VDDCFYPLDFGTVVFELTTGAGSVGWDFALFSGMGPRCTRIRQAINPVDVDRVGFLGPVGQFWTVLGAIPCAGRQFQDRGGTSVPVQGLLSSEASLM